MSLDKLSKDDLIIGGITLLLLIDLLFFPWISISVSFLGNSVSASDTATGAPDGWTGIFAVIVLIALLADLLIERFSPQTAIPMIGGSRIMTRTALAGVAAFFIALKWLFHLSDTVSYAGFGFWLGLILTIALILGSLRLSQGKAIMPSGQTS